MVRSSLGNRQWLEFPYGCAKDGHASEGRSREVLSRVGADWKEVDTSDECEGFLKRRVEARRKYLRSVEPRY